MAEGGQKHSLKWQGSSLLRLNIYLQYFSPFNSYKTRCAWEGVLIIMAWDTCPAAIMFQLIPSQNVLDQKMIQEQTIFGLWWNVSDHEI